MALSIWSHRVEAPSIFVMADEEDVCVKMRQRCVIEFCVKLGKSGNETLEILRQAYGGETLSCAAVFQWWRHFKDGSTRVIDKACSGRPSTAVTYVNINKAADLLENDLLQKRGSNMAVSKILIRDRVISMRVMSHVTKVT